MFFKIFLRSFQIVVPVKLDILLWNLIRKILISSDQEQIKLSFGLILEL